MYSEDYLLRAVQRLVAALASRSGARDEQQQELTDALRETTGLSLRTLDALPAAALIELLASDDPLAVERALAVAEVLDRLAAGSSRATSRQEKAAALREAFRA